MRATVVLPEPGGPQKIIEPKLGAAMRRVSAPSGPVRCSWPAISLRSCGRRRSASGAAGGTKSAMRERPQARPPGLVKHRRERPSRRSGDEERLMIDLDVVRRAGLPSSDPEAAGFSPRGLERLVEGPAIARRPQAGSRRLRVALSQGRRRLCQPLRRGPARWDGAQRRNDLPHLFHDQADRLARGDDAGRGRPAAAFRALEQIYSRLRRHEGWRGGRRRAPTRRPQTAHHDPGSDASHLRHILWLHRRDESPQGVPCRRTVAGRRLRSKAIAK